MGIPISLLRKLYGGLVIFTDDILLMAPAKEELTFARDTLDIYLLQNLGFLINRKKSVLEPCQNIQLLGMEINSIEMTLTLPQNRKGKIVQVSGSTGEVTSLHKGIKPKIGRLAYSNCS